MKKPRIGITLDSEESGGYSQLPWYALRKNYVDSIVNAGAFPSFFLTPRSLRQPM